MSKIGTGYRSRLEKDRKVKRLIRNNKPLDIFKLPNEEELIKLKDDIMLELNKKTHTSKQK